MKLVKQDETSFTFLIGKREKEVLIALLLRYPVLSTNHYRARHPAQSKEAATDDDLLRESLAEQQRDSRRHLEDWLKTENRFRDSDLGFLFSITPAEMEWLLQILNDIRVGSWVALGQPDGHAPPATPLTEESMQLAWALDMAGLFQHVLLHALQPADPPEPAKAAE